MSAAVSPFWVEDVWITGILPLYLGIGHAPMNTHVLKASCGQVISREALATSHAVRSRLHDMGRCKYVDAPTLYHTSSWMVLKSIATFVEPNSTAVVPG